MHKNRVRRNVSARSRRSHRRGQSRSVIIFVTLLLCTLAAVASGALFSNKFEKASAAPQSSADISPEALAQIEALIRDKESRTPAQQKIDSQLLYQARMDRGEAIAANVPTLETDLKVEDGKVTVDITATVTDRLLADLRAKGAEILSAKGSGIRANVATQNLEAIAALDSIKFIQPKQEAMTSADPIATVDDKNGLRGNLQPNFNERATRIQSLLTSAISGGGAQGNVAGTPAPSGVGSKSSEGDVTHRANIARGVFHVNGTGIKIGVLSDGVTNLAASQALGDLGPVTVLPGQTGSGDEGTAMLEIIHDVAPGAQLYFATALGSITSFAQNIRDLRTAGCDIIVDDIFYFVETPFQDGQLAPTNTNGGVVIQAVNDVTASGALYFSSAGNSGNLDQGTSGVWEGDFVDGGPTAAPIPLGNRLHNFGGQNFNVTTVAGTGRLSINWSDPLGGSANDYDLFRLDSTGATVQASSTNIQNGTQDPYEEIVSQAANSRVVIVKKAGSADRFLHLDTNRGRLSIATAGQERGHSVALNAFGMAATPAASPFGPPPNPTGPFPGTFNSANVTEVFSSDGPRRIFFQADGTPYTPGNFSSTGGIVRQKPDLTAADGTSVTGVGGFPNPFFGTSAAAPHAAAISGILKSANPLLTPAQIRSILTGTAIDIMTPGTDRTSGAGIIDAYAATAATGATGTAFLTLGTITALEDPGNGSGTIDGGETASLSIQLVNQGVNNATGITATLSSSTPGVTIIPPNSASYPDLAAGGGSGTNSPLFHFSLAGNIPCPTTLNFTLNVTLTGGPSQALNFTVLSGPPATNITSTLDTTAPTPGPGFTTSTGTIAVRHFRDGVASSCGPPKAFPGTTQPGTRQYDAYTFQTCPNSGPACITVNLSGANAINLFTAAYTGNFNPADLSQNYLADAGASAASRTYSFNLPGGAQTFTVIVYDVPPGAASNSVYTLNVSGGCIGTCPVIPVLSANGSSLVNESCPPNNGAVDPGERVTMNLRIANNGTAATSNLVATLQPSANVIAPSDPQNYGAIPSGGTTGRDFSFTAAGNCGDLITATLQLQDGSVNLGTVSYTFRLGVATPGTPLTENFDGVVAPALPAGWTTSATGAEVAWVTSTTNSSSAPNNAFAPDVALPGDTELVSPVIHINGSPAQVSFRNAFNLESTFDGGVLEISIDGGAYQDILSAGGSFVSGGYNAVLVAGTLNPISGRSAWTGLSGGTTAAPTYLNTVVNLPNAAAGKDIRLKWRVGADDTVAASGTAPGQRIDNIVVSDTAYACTTPCGGVRLVVTSSLSRTGPSTVVASFTVQNIGSAPANNVMLNLARLGVTNGTPVPQSLGNLAPGASASSTVNFTNSTSGASSTLTLGGSYTGGSYTSTKRVTIP